MASSNMIADMTTVIANGPTSATTALATANSGPIMDYAGNTNEVLLGLKETSYLIGKVITDTDAGDPSLTNLNAIQAALTGGGSPTTTAITAMTSVINAGPTSA